MTPLYDVLSAWPVIGRGANQLPIQDAKLAMAVVGKHRHYRLLEIQARHWRALAAKVGGLNLWDRKQGLVNAAAGAFDRIELPRGFPDEMISRISSGVRGQADRFLKSIRLETRD